MRAFVRVLPLFAAAAQFAACAAGSVAPADPDAGRVAAFTRPDEIAARRPIDAMSPKVARALAALLKRQPAPQCDLSKPPEEIGPNDVRVVTLDYERQCYRQFAQIEHDRIAALQDTVARGHPLGSLDPVLLQREPPPHCDAAKPAPGATPAAARAAALADERQCYQRLAAAEGTRLAALQDAVRLAIKSSNTAVSAAPHTRPPPQRLMSY